MTNDERSGLPWRRHSCLPGRASSRPLSAEMSLGAADTSVCATSGLACTRRQFFGRTSTGIGIAALANLFQQNGLAAGGLQGLPHFAPKARRVIFLHQSGGPSHLDLFDYKPELKKQQGVDLPASVRMGQRITGMTSGQSTLPVTPSIF